MISMFAATLPPEQIAQIKTAFSKIDEFAPLIDSYHSTIPLKEEENEKRVSYLLDFESGKLMLRQVVLAADPNLKKVIINRTLYETDCLEKAREIIKSV